MLHTHSMCVCVCVCAGHVHSRARACNNERNEWTGQVCRIRDGLSIKYAECVYNGFWFSPEMEFLENAMDHTQRHVNGETRLRWLVVLALGMLCVRRASSV